MPIESSLSISIMRSLKGFDFYFQPSINHQETIGFQHMDFLEKVENIIFIGISGIGKTHLATALKVLNPSSSAVMN